MYDCLFVVRSVTAGQRGKAALERRGISARLLRSPGGLSENGCAYALYVRRRELRRAARLLEEARVEAPAYCMQPDGSYQRAAP